MTGCLVHREHSVAVVNMGSLVMEIVVEMYVRVVTIPFDLPHPVLRWCDPAFSAMAVVPALHVPCILHLNLTSP